MQTKSNEFNLRGGISEMNGAKQGKKSKSNEWSQ
jgi:hypothetical protein